MAYWKPLVVNGQPVDLSHLEPFSFTITVKSKTVPPKGQSVEPSDSGPPPDREVTIRVTFYNHCFSEAFDAARHRNALPKSHVSRFEERAFDSVRYELSKQLPAFVRSFDGSKITQTRIGTLARVTIADGRDYGIFFTLSKCGKDACELSILSAYPLEAGNNVAATGYMKFKSAVLLVLDNKKPKFPSGRF